MITRRVNCGRPQRAKELRWLLSNNNCSVAPTFAKISRQSPVIFRPMKKSAISYVGVLLLSLGCNAYAHAPKTHRLEATPATVAYGYYWSDARPVLRIDSGERSPASTRRNASINSAVNIGERRQS